MGLCFIRWIRAPPPLSELVAAWRSPGQPRAAELSTSREPLDLQLRHGCLHVPTCASLPRRRARRRSIAGRRSPWSSLQPPVRVVSCRTTPRQEPNTLAQGKLRHGATPPSPLKFAAGASPPAGSCRLRHLLVRPGHSPLLRRHARARRRPAPASSSASSASSTTPAASRGEAPLLPTSSESIRSVRIRSTTLVRLLHGFVLLPSGISVAGIGNAMI